MRETARVLRFELIVVAREDGQMRREWLGDALDFWKGSLLEVLRDSMNQLHVVPMFTDAGWTTQELDTYAALLNLNQSALLTTAQLTNSGRASYFRGLKSRIAGDVFIDPDNGVAPSKPKPAHIDADEVVALLTEENVAAVYQHRPQRTAAPWLQRYTSLLTSRQVRVVGYESAQVGMLFATKSSAREAAVRQALITRLGAAQTRVM